MSDRLQQILTLADSKPAPSAQQIAALLDVSPGYVYGILRTHRPDRPRKARTRTSDKPRMIRGLAAQGISVARVAFLCQCTKAYVYRAIGETTESANATNAG